MAPILAFTAEEIWNFMPGHDMNSESVHMTSLPVVNKEWKDEQLAEEWKKIIEIRGEVTKALEEARVKKLIGHSLDASITIYTDGDRYDILEKYKDDLRTIFIVSEVSMIKGDKADGIFKSLDIEGLSIQVKLASGEKCERCWIHDISVGADSEQPTICSRCQNALGEMKTDSFIKE
jgi:isoleucyl-tRNA synthetase